MPTSGIGFDGPKAEDIDAAIEACDACYPAVPATSFLTRSVCGASANVLWPPNFGRADTACFVLTPDEPANGA